MRTQPTRRGGKIYPLHSSIISPYLIVSTTSFLNLMSNKSIKPEPDKSIDDLIIVEDDDLIFLEEESEEKRDLASPSTWKILIVDDDASVHQATKRLQTGQRIRIDGSTGSITILAEE